MGGMMVCEVLEDTDLLRDGLCIMTLFNIDNIVDGNSEFCNYHSLPF